jgi:predicted hydrocarbon binding protein
MTLSDAAIPCSSQIGQMMFEGVWEVTGQAGAADLNILLKQSPPKIAVILPAEQSNISFDDLSAIQLALESLYGRLGGQGVALRAGRAAGSQVFRRYGVQMGLQALDYRLLPGPNRVRAGLSALAAKVSELSCNRFIMTENPDAWLWQGSFCPVCWQRQSELPACYFIVGLLQEFLSIISGGKIFNVVETECRAVGGDACIFSIDKQVLEQ